MLKTRPKRASRSRLVEHPIVVAVRLARERGLPLSDEEIRERIAHIDMEDCVRDVVVCVMRKIGRENGKMPD